MKLKNLVLATAMAFAAGNAAAVVITDTPNIDLYLSGATAPDTFLDSLFTSVFEPGYLNYVDSKGSANAFRAYFGKLKSTADIPAGLRGKTVRIVKRSAGGSVWGVNPVARAQGIRTLGLTTGDCTAGSGTAADPYRCAIVGVDPGLGSPTGRERVPDFGVSDVNPNMFKQPFNVEFGQGQLTTAEAAALAVKPANTLSMGFVATNAIPGSTYLSRASYGAMLSGNVQDWTQVDASLAPPAGNQVVVCRRVQGSGTQSSYNWFFNNFPCTTQSIAGSGQTVPARMSDSAGYQEAGSGTSADPYVINPVSGYTVIENSGSGDVRSCLAAANNGGTYAFTDEAGKSYKVNFGSGGYGAIGVLSADSMGKESGWSFRNMDGAGTTKLVSGAPVVTGTGIAPTKANLIEGKYDFAAELTMQYRNKTVGSVPALAGDKKAFADFFITRAGSPTYNTKEWVAALPPAYDPTTTANVAKGTRFGNMCSPLQKLY